MIDDGELIKIIVPSSPLDCAITDLLEDNEVNETDSNEEREHIRKVATNTYVDLINDR